MIDPVTAYPVANPLAGPDLAQAAPAPLPAVSAADQAQFQEALRPPVETPVASQMAAPLESRVERLPSPGDVILQNLDNLRAGYRELSSQVESMARQPDLSPQELLNLQMQVSQVTLSTQLVSQVASKIEQDMNTLLKSS